MNLDLDAIEALARAATPGPWEQGDVWQWAGVMSEKFGEGRCACCGRSGEPVLVERRDINGKMMLAHKHRNNEPWEPDHLISSQDGLVAGSYDYDTGGIMDGEDCAYIAAVSPDVVLALIDEVRRARCETWTGETGTFEGFRFGDQLECPTYPCPGCVECRPAAPRAGGRAE